MTNLSNVFNRDEGDKRVCEIVIKPLDANLSGTSDSGGIAPPSTARLLQADGKMLLKETKVAIGG